MNRESSERRARLEGLLETRILCLDGAMGTAIQARELSPGDFGGEPYEGCNEMVSVTRPDVIRAIHDAHLAAGADIIETNSFGSASIALAEYGLAGRAYELTLAAARVARAAADAASTPDEPRFVAGSMGPTNKPSITIAGTVGFDEVRVMYKEQARALVEGGVDYLLLETCQDARNIKAGAVGILELFDELGFSVPVAVSGTIERFGGATLAGQTAEALVTSLAHLDLLYLGLNCATGPEAMTDHLRVLAELAKTRVACVPNAGLPDEELRYNETPEKMAAALGRFIEEGWLNLVGGCCGTRPEHTAALARLVKGKRPRAVPSYHRTLVSGLEMVEVADENRPVLVGERTNSLGSRLFKQLIADEKYEQASEIARRQVKNGAQVLDVCLQNPDRDERHDMERLLDFVIRKVKAPLMIDTTDADVLARALTFSQGKAIINSINLEDGGERLARVVPLAKRFGAALVVGCIDEQGMAVSRERKLEIAARSCALLTAQHGVDPSDILFDPLVFPCATGDANYLGSAAETVEGIRLIKEALPDCKTILGISNVSFGLPPAGREVLNAVFLYHTTKAGLDLAIVNAEKLERYAAIPEQERRLAEDVLFHGSDAVVAAFTAHFRARPSRLKEQASTQTLDQRLSSYIITGSKDGLAADLERKLEEAKPLDIINGPLMAGMDEVGRLFNNNELIVAEVLQSAEAMKAAVSFLEPLMEKDAHASRGVVLLATVKGDVHDIGKNLVEIILANNGYQVHNLGIKVPPHDLLAAIEQHDPDIVGLSGLLVRSAEQMVVTAREMTLAARCPPLLVGGAALTKSFTLKKIAPAYQGLCVYAGDAMKGLDLANKIMSPAGRAALEQTAEEQRRKLAERVTKPVVEGPAAPGERGVRPLERLPAPPDFERHVMREVPLDEVWTLVNPKMLYGKHLGLKGDPKELLDKGDHRAASLAALVDELKASARPGGAWPMFVRAVWQFFPAASAGDTLKLYAPHDPEQVLVELAFPRREEGDRLCLADYLRAEGSEHPGRDAVCLFVVTAGEGIRARYEALKAEGRYLPSHAVQALALETAEAAAEWLHKKLRAQWGFPDRPELTRMDLFQAHYRGKRYSFGYPACPDLAMQAPLFSLLHPEEIGVTLTEEHMMDPEASVSALVVHHPEARYFSVGKEEP